MARDPSTSERCATPESVGAILGVRAKNTLSIRNAIRAGLPFAALAAVSASLALPLGAAGLLLGMSAGAVLRRRAGGHLTPQESDRLYRIARVVAEARDTLGSTAKAREWLQTPNRALGGEKPLDLLDTDLGARQVEEVLLRLDHGIFG